MGIACCLDSAIAALGLICLMGLVSPSFAETQSLQPVWSEPIRSESDFSCLQARIGLEQTSVLNGTNIITATLFLRNCSDVNVPTVIAWHEHHLSFQIVDAAGKDVDDVRSTPPYNGFSVPAVALILPAGGEISFPISSVGAGVGKDKAGHLEFGPDNVFGFQTSDRELYLRAVLEIPKGRNRRPDDLQEWRGRIVIPKVQVPLKPDK